MFVYTFVCVCVCVYVCVLGKAYRIQKKTVCVRPVSVRYGLDEFNSLL